jgi:hypothetical protein
VPTLLEVISALEEIPAGDGYSPGPTIYAKRPWTLTSDALVLRGDEMPAGPITESGHHYLLEVNLAIEAVEVWSSWRNGATPSPEEATDAVIYYGDNDAYQPLPSFPMARAPYAADADAVGRRANQPRSEQLALPGFQIRFARRQCAGAVPVQPCGSSTLGLLLVRRHAVAVQLENVGEDGEADLDLRWRLPELVPVVDAVEHGMVYRAARHPPGETSDRAGRTATQMVDHARNLLGASPSSIRSCPEVRPGEGW